MTQVASTLCIWCHPEHTNMLTTLQSATVDALHVHLTDDRAGAISIKDELLNGNGLLFYMRPNAAEERDTNDTAGKTNWSVRQPSLAASMTKHIDEGTRSSQGNSVAYYSWRIVIVLEMVHSTKDQTKWFGFAIRLYNIHFRINHSWTCSAQLQLWCNACSETHTWYAALLTWRD